MITSHLTTSHEPPRHLTLAHGVGDISEIGGGPIRVVIAENSCIIREGLSSMLGAAPEVDLAAVCSTGRELQAAIAAENPDVVLTGIRMPPSETDEGIRVAARLRETSPETGVVVLTQYAEPSYALGLFDKGAARRAYLLKGGSQNGRADRCDRNGCPGRLGDRPPDPRRAHPGPLSGGPLPALDISPRASAKCSRRSQPGKSNGAIAESLFLTGTRRRKARESILKA